MSDGLKTASLIWEKDAVLRSADYNDIYFSDTDGLAETRHVFLNGNELPDRFRSLESDTHFSVGELGFGTGLNTLALWQLWKQRGHDHGQLHIASTEGFPLSADDFRKAHNKIQDRWPELAALSQKLVYLYPPLTPGLHTLRLDREVTLTLAFGYADKTLPEMSGRYNAWFLDGFSPAENPDMWSPEIMSEVARLSAPGATAATFTVAGSVRRALNGAGFDLEKRPGFGRKREMLTACLTAPAHRAASKPWFALDQHQKVSGKRALIIGAGIAGASIAWHLKRAGLEVTVVDQAGQPASCASGNPAGLILPRLELDNTPSARFYRSAFLYTINLIRELEEAHTTEICHSQGGLLLGKSRDASARYQRLLAEGIWPTELLQARLEEELHNITRMPLNVPEGTSHLQVTAGGTISPAAFVNVLLQDTSVQKSRLVSCQTAEHENSQTLAKLEAPDGTVSAETDYLIIATSLDANSILDTAPLTASLGQLDIVDLPPPDCAFTFGNYVAPHKGKTVTGATYENVDPATNHQPSPERTAENLEALTEILPDVRPGLSVSQSRTALRAVTADRHPVAGPLPEWGFYRDAYGGLRHGKKQSYPAARYQQGIYVLTGLGSRGLTTAPYCASLIASLIMGTPAPLSIAEQNLVHPARFLIRQLKRNQ